jgi:hypothetical protein
MLNKPILIVLAALCIAAMPKTYASELPLQRLAPGTMEQWEYTTTPGEHWTEPHDAPEPGLWKPVSVGTPAPYPDGIEPHDQYRWPFIWAAQDVQPGKAVYFRRWFTLDGQIQAATLRFCSHAEATVVYLNGKRLVEIEQPGTLTTVDVTDRVQTGTNWLAIAVIRGQNNYGLLAMGEAELTWPPHTLQWYAKDTLDPREMLLERAQLPGRAQAQAPAWTIPPLLPHGAASGWKLAEPALNLELEGVGYPTIQPQGGMPEYSAAYFKTQFAAYGAITSAVLQVLGDDSYEVYVNGYPVAVEKRMDRAYIPVRVEIAAYLMHGNMTNILAAKVTNDWGPGRVHIQPTVIMQF